MKFYLKLGAILLLIASIASGILAVVNNLTDPIIKNNQLETEKLARKEVLSLAITFEEKIDKDFKYYCGKDDNGKIVGYTFVAFGPGYSSTIKTMVGVNLDFSIENIKIIYQAETPGLGANCSNPDFPDRFKTLTVKDMKVDKDGGKIASITGATISTRAISDSINKGLTSLIKAVTNKEGK